MSVSRAQREVDSNEFTHWKQYYRIDPRGEERADLRMGILATVLVRLLGKKSIRVDPSKFMPKFRGKRQSFGEMAAILKAAAGAAKHGNNRNASGQPNGQNGRV